MTPRARAFVASLLVPVLGGLFIGGYIIGSHVEHPNSVVSQVVVLLVGWVFSLLVLLWQAADSGPKR